ncbi:hypothetical protein [Ensifer aridi]|uniref:hypothetical protein n=1 Tax=Ensifer aridi TaxID=1708715 RepID=UPI00111C0043|nr:hypothetical protein [Ensifer aridi]
MADHKQEMIEMARRCSAEIKELRAHIARLEPKAHAYDNLCSVLRLLPQPSVGYSEDLAWRLDNRVNELTRENVPVAESGNHGSTEVAV